jgi:hypothetical protein
MVVRKHHVGPGQMEAAFLHAIACTAIVRDQYALGVAGWNAARFKCSHDHRDEASQPGLGFSWRGLGSRRHAFDIKVQASWRIGQDYLIDRGCRAGCPLVEKGVAVARAEAERPVLEQDVASLQGGDSGCLLVQSLRRGGGGSGLLVALGGGGGRRSRWLGWLSWSYRKSVLLFVGISDTLTSRLSKCFAYGGRAQLRPHMGVSSHPDPLVFTITYI